MLGGTTGTCHINTDVDNEQKFDYYNNNNNNTYSHPFKIAMLNAYTSENFHFHLSVYFNTMLPTFWEICNNAFAGLQEKSNNMSSIALAAPGS